VGLGEEYLVNNHSNSNNSHSHNSNQLLVDLEQRSNHNSRVEDCLETRSVILGLSQPVSQRLVVSDVILPRLITHWYDIGGGGGTFGSGGAFGTQSQQQQQQQPQQQQQQQPAGGLFGNTQTQPSTGFGAFGTSYGILTKPSVN
jgi:hypothetical protein